MEVSTLVYKARKLFLRTRERERQNKKQQQTQQKM